MTSDREDLMKRSHVVPITLLIAWGCDDDAAEPRVPDHEDGPTSAATVVPVPTCTKSWASAIGGLWSDASRWTPVGVPSITDHVCIDAAGTYDVFHSLPITVQSLRIGVTILIDRQLPRSTRFATKA
jgi:hypothetical protein